MKHFLFLLLSFLFVDAGIAQPQLPTPDDFLGYELGTRFSRHHQVVDYFERIAELSDQVQLAYYGETNERRPLLTAYIASPENMARLDEIRRNNLRLAHLETGEATGNAPAIVWLSYNVHGNESVSTEAAMKTLHALADPDNARTQAWLENTVVIIDPCLNPDGRDRYVNWYNQRVGAFPNPKPEAWEHQEPWPGGRTNHYYFDLNRDWAWMTQKELQARVPHYNAWMPHVHVDFHEQGVNSPYYFAPAAEPLHEAITPWQRELQMLIGKNHAKYFDANGWLYFTRQVYDLLYPGYGDSWPMFNGGIGMTYEQGGSGRAGLGIITAEGDTLTLRDRILHHYTTGLSTIEVASQQQDRLIQEFRAFYDTATSSPAGGYQAYVLKGLQASDTRRVVEDYFRKQGIAFGYAARSRTVDGFQYADGGTGRVTVAAGDMVLSAKQPKSTLLRVLFDPQPVLSDSVTYDMTSWALPYVFGLDAYALPDALEPDIASFDEPVMPPLAITQPYAYLVEWESFEDAQFLASVLRKGIKLRYAEKAFEIDGHTYAPGTLILTRRGNERMGERFDRVIRDAADAHRQPLHAVPTGFVTKGSDFGSGDVRFLKRPNVAVMTGESTFSSGEVWHFFDQQLAYPVTLLNTANFSPAVLDDYDVLILPAGSYRSILNGDNLEGLKQWVQSGGRLVALESAVAFFAGKEDFSIKAKKAAEDSTDHAARTYGDRDRVSISDDVPGAIYRVRLDNSHPLAFGYGNTYYTLKRSDDVYEYLEGSNDWNVGVLPENGHLSGFVGHELKDLLEEAMVIGVQSMGRGDVVYLADNPLFRGFWYNGRLLMANAVFMR